MEKYFDTLANIKRVNNCTDRSFDYIISKVNMDLTINSTKQFNNEIKKDFPIYSQLRNLEVDRDEKTIKSEYVEVFCGALGNDYSYIEKRDN